MSKTLTGAYPSGYTYNYAGAGSASLSVTATASIGGAGLVASKLASVINAGQIIATTYGAAGASLTKVDNVSNSATIAGAAGHHGGPGGVGGAGLVLSAGSLANSGNILGGAGGPTGGFGGGGLTIATGSVTNSGTIIGGVGGGAGSGKGSSNGGLGGVGVSVSTGDVVNNATIVGGSGGVGSEVYGGYGGGGGTGVSVTNGRLFNHGDISGGAQGAYANGGGGGLGATLSGASTYLYNSGDIQGGAGLHAGDGVQVTNAAGVIVNKAGGQISGFNGIEQTGTGALTVTNYGTIAGTHASVLFKSASDRLILVAGSKLTSVAVGGGGLLKLTQFPGTIKGLGTAFVGFGEYWVDGIHWNMTGTNTLAGQKILVTGGLTVAGALTGFGVVRDQHEVSIATTGTIESKGAQRLVLEGEGKFAGLFNAGLLEASGKGGIELTSIGVSNGGTILATNGSRVLLKGAAIQFGTLKTTGTGLFETGAGLNVLNGLFEPVTNAGSIKVMGGTGLTLLGEVANAGVLTLATSATGAATLTIGEGAGELGRVTLTGGGEIRLGDAAGNGIIGPAFTTTLTNASDKIVGSGQISGKYLFLVNQAGATILGKGSVGLTIDTGIDTITNGGFIQSNQTMVSIKSAVANTGTLMAYNGGTLSVTGAVTGAGKVRIGGGTAIFASAFTENVTFYGDGGTLELAQSQAYGGTIAGFSKTSTTVLDLDDIAYTKGTTTASFVENASGTSGVLTVTDGTHTAKFKLNGDYSTSTFITSSDGHGGTKVVDPPGSASPAAFVSRAAAMTGGGGSMVAAQVQAKPLAPLLAPSG